MRRFVSLLLLNLVLNGLGEVCLGTHIGDYGGSPPTVRGGHGGSPPEDYHPDQCNVTSYKFTFIKGLVHGLWPEGCSQCERCSYPTCCQMEKFSKFVMPSDTSFIDNYWFNGESHHPGQVCGFAVETLFAHEVLKHGSCMGMFADEYMRTVSKIYSKHQSDFDKLCHSRTECEVNLNADREPIGERGFPISPPTCPHRSEPFKG